MKSTSPGEQSVLRLCNFTSSRTVSVFWIDYDGNRVKYSILDPGQIYSQGIYNSYTCCHHLLEGLCKVSCTGGSPID